MEGGKKITSLIVKLNKLTQAGEITWEARDDHFRLGTHEEFLDKIYYCTYKTKNFRVYNYRYRYYTDEETYHWISRHRLELIDGMGETDYVFPEERAVSNLYDSVRYQVAGVDDIIDDLLEDDDIVDEDLL